MATPPVVLERLLACPSKITLSVLYSSSTILFSTAPKMSGRFEERLSRFLRMSTSSPWVWEDSCGFFFCARQVLRCLFISEARMFCLQAWHCCRISLFFGSEMIFSSIDLGIIEACCCILAISSPSPMLLWSVSKEIVSTS